MFKRSIRFGLTATLLAGVAALSLATSPAEAADGADLTIWNDTGVDVDVIVWEGDGTHHHKDAGGIHAGTVKNGKSGTGHVKKCIFHVYLFDSHDNVFHKRFTDCKITDIHITKTDDPHKD